MELLKPGDLCPCCGQPIRVEDPELLLLLNWIAWLRADQTRDGGDAS